MLIPCRGTRRRCETYLMLSDTSRRVRCHNQECTLQVRYGIARWHRSDEPAFGVARSYACAASVFRARVSCGCFFETPWRDIPGRFGAGEPAGQALGHSRGGLKTKIHMLCEANGTPLRFLLSGGQANDLSFAHLLLDDLCISTSQRGRPRKDENGCWLTRTTTRTPCADTATDIHCRR